MMASILVFGSSISYGAWDTEGGWVVRLRKEIDKKILKNPKFPFEHDPLLYNLGVSGYSTKELVQHFEQEAEARIHRTKVDLIIFEIGLNDSIVMKDRTNYVSQEEFVQNINTLIQLAKMFTEKILFLSFTPVDEAKVKPIPWALDRSYTNESILTYNAMLKEVCQHQTIPVLDIWSIFLKHNPKLLLKDGVHPNNKGHELIFKQVSIYLKKQKYI
jgi:lysophospholipase L1-like esterase